MTNLRMKNAGVQEFKSRDNGKVNEMPLSPGDETKFEPQLGSICFHQLKGYPAWPVGCHSFSKSAQIFLAITPHLCMHIRRSYANFQSFPVNMGLWPDILVFYIPLIKVKKIIFQNPIMWGINLFLRV